MKSFIAVISAFFAVFLIVSCTKEKLVVVEKSSKVFYSEAQDIGQAD